MKTSRPLADRLDSFIFKLAIAFLVYLTFSTVIEWMNR